MKTLLLITTLLFTNWLAMPVQENYTVTLTIEFDITKYDKGSILLALYDSEDTYMKKAFKNSKVSVNGKNATVVIEDIASGSYGF